MFAILCALLFGWAMGGRLSRYEGAGLRALPLPVLALLGQSAAFRLDLPAPAGLLLVGSYLVLFAFLWLNRHLPLPSLLLGVGSLLNLIVIAANGMHMPVSQSALTHLSAQGAADLLSGKIPMYCAASDSTRLLFLGDVIWFPVPFFQGFASIGDVFLAAGVFCLLLAVMAPTRLPIRWKGRS